MKIEYLWTLFSAFAVLLIVAIWTLCVFVQRRHTTAPDVPEEYTQVQLFAFMGCCIVAVCGLLGV